MKVLVTGATGFIGGRVMRAINEKGWEAFGISRRGDSSLLLADITDLPSLTALNSKGPFGAVVHCAGIAHRFDDVPESEYQRVNVEGTANVAEFAVKNGITKFIHLSSVLVYGRHGIGIDETETCNPVDAYAMSKLAGEGVAAEICANAGIALTILRPAPVIGEGCKGNFQRLIRAIDRGRFVNVGDGSNQKSMIYVADLAAACISALENGHKTGVERFNVASGPIAVRDLLASVYQACNKKQPSFSIPSQPLVSALSKLKSLSRSSVINSAARSLETWISDDVFSTEAISERLGWVAQVSVNEAVLRTVAAQRSGGDQELNR